MADFVVHVQGRSHFFCVLGVGYCFSLTFHVARLLLILFQSFSDNVKLNMKGAVGCFFFIGTLEEIFSETIL